MPNEGKAGERPENPEDNFGFSLLALKHLEGGTRTLLISLSTPEAPLRFFSLRSHQEPERYHEINEILEALRAALLRPYNG